MKTPSIVIAAICLVSCGKVQAADTTWPQAAGPHGTYQAEGPEPPVRWSVATGEGGKHSIFEGGTHLPTVIHWPNGKVADGLCGALDMFPTLTAMAGLEMPETRPLDGKNIWPALRDKGATRIPK